MTAYIFRRLLLMIPTLIGVLTITFMVTEFVPGGPSDQIRAMLEGRAGEGQAREAASGSSGREGKERLDPREEQQLRRMFNLHLSSLERYLRTLLWFSRDSVISSLEIGDGETHKFQREGHNYILLRKGDDYHAFRNAWGQGDESGEVVYDRESGAWKSVLNGTLFVAESGARVDEAGPGLEVLDLEVKPGAWQYEVGIRSRLHHAPAPEPPPEDTVVHLDLADGILLLRSGDRYLAAPAAWSDGVVDHPLHFDAEAGHWATEHGIRFDPGTGKRLDDPYAASLTRVRVRRVKRDEVYVQESVVEALTQRENWHGFFLFQFGKSIYRNKTVVELIVERLPVSASLGFWSFLITYPTCIFLGIAKAVRNGTRFDAATSAAILLGYSIPGFVLAVLLIVFFGPGEASLVNLFPLSGLTSAGVDGYADWTQWQKIVDYFHHLAAPILCLSIGGFAVLTLLTKNSLLEETERLYAVAARARGLSERKVLYKHILRNSLIPLVTTFPSTFLFLFLTGSLLIERIFNIDGLGLLGYASVMDRDFPVIMGSLFIFTLIKLFGQLLTDICYVIVDPRISFEGSGN